ncbi:MAG: hypothetical protein KJ600_02125 [Nanoarchaeota archaeon]|nr:hypothetical protein [Nanoarchaeota archaeon]MBU1103333.1 hypothetical protein [Nanoarchaeota archaeon]
MPLQTNPQKRDLIKLPIAASQVTQSATQTNQIIITNPNNSRLVLSLIKGWGGNYRSYFLKGYLLKIKKQSPSATHIIPSDSGLCDNLWRGSGIKKVEKYIFTQCSHQLNLKHAKTK